MTEPTGPVNDWQCCPQLAVVKTPEMGQRVTMRHLVSASAFVLVTGCLPVSTYYAEGVSVAKMDRDTLRCEVRAMQQAPVANQTRQHPAQYVTQQSCDSYGNCHEYSRWIPGSFYTVDVNTSLRERIQKQCMGERGYRQVEIPACGPEVEKNAPAKSTTIMPRLGPDSCAIRQNNGRFLVVN